MKIAFVASAYTKAEAFASVIKSFERLGHKVYYYPVYQKSFDIGTQECAKTRKTGLNDHEIKQAGLPQMYNEIFALATKCDMMLIWKAENVHPEIVRRCSQVTKTVYYSWDDPYQLELDEYALSRPAACHVAFSWCAKTARIYEATGAKKGLWLPPGYDPEVHYEDGDPEVDVCFVATNTYCKEIYGDKCFDRRDLVRAILDVTKSVELYGQGTEPLGWLHPQHGDPSFAPYYKGFIQFAESRKAYSRAKLCISSHVRRSGQKYFNERTFQVIGCKRALVVDDNPGHDDMFGSRLDSSIFPRCYTYKSVNELKDVVKKALSATKEGPGFVTPKSVGQAAYGFSKEYTWDRFCEKILKEVE